MGSSGEKILAGESAASSAKKPRDRHKLKDVHTSKSLEHERQSPMHLSCYQRGKRATTRSQEAATQPGSVYRQGSAYITSRGIAIWDKKASGMSSQSSHGPDPRASMSGIHRPKLPDHSHTPRSHMLDGRTKQAAIITSFPDPKNQERNRRQSAPTSPHRETSSAAAPRRGFLAQLGTVRGLNHNPGARKELQSHISPRGGPPTSHQPMKYRGHLLRLCTSRRPALCQRAPQAHLEPPKRRALFFHASLDPLSFPPAERIAISKSRHQLPQPPVLPPPAPSSTPQTAPSTFYPHFTLPQSSPGATDHRRWMLHFAPIKTCHFPNGPVAYERVTDNEGKTKRRRASR